MSNKAKIATLTQEWDNGQADDGRTIIDAIREHYNCQAVEIDDDGDVWIAGPMTGRWLSDDEIGKLVEAIG
jgi:hypothetical protein